jgi:zinc-finger of acetyl-transferase ESCO
MNADGSHSVTRRAPVETASRLCDVCGFCYAPWLAEDRRAHGAFHAAYMRPRRPKPNPRLAAHEDDVRVDREIPRWLHRLVFDCALALKHDQKYDWPQWDKDRPPRMYDNERDKHALLLVENGTVPVGAVSFSWIDWPSAGAMAEGSPASGWHMFFAWVADDWRRKGVMSRRWRRWLSTYGDFSLEPPLSDAMAAFVRSRAWDKAAAEGPGRPS